MSKNIHSLTFPLKPLKNIDFAKSCKTPQSQNIKLCYKASLCLTFLM